MPPSPDTPGKPGLRLAITPFLVLSLGGLVLLSMAGVLVLTLGTAARNTVELLQDKSRLVIDAVVLQLEQHLEPARAQADFVGDMIAAGNVGPEDEERLGLVLQAALAATPQVQNVAWLDPDGWLLGAGRVPQRGALIRESWLDDPVTASGVEDARHHADRRAYWGMPVFVRVLDETILNLRRPVVRDGEFLGVVVAVVTLRGISEFLADLGTGSGLHPFVLYDRERVLAHRALEHGFPDLSPERPLPRTTEIGDPVLFQIWREGWEGRRIQIDHPGHVDELAGREWVYLYRELDGLADRPLLVGSYFETRAVAGEIDRLWTTLQFALAAMVAAVLVAVLLGRWLGRPIQRLALAAGALRELRLEGVPELRRSRLRELDQALSAFEAMVRGLQVFARYVPRTLVLRLIGQGATGPLPSETREVTVLFTDIVGFTRLAEDLTGEQTAALLNDHFRLVTACIEAEAGTVDKFIGDAVMAFWNAPEPQPDHARRALAAARAIARAVHEDNAARTRPLRLRIGIATGSAVVGNIGAPSRMNYTLIGDTVNTAERLQGLARRLLPEEEVAVLATGATLARAGERGIADLGPHRLRGRAGVVEIHRVA
jgi:adenylate cyclase